MVRKQSQKKQGYLAGWPAEVRTFAAHTSWNHSCVTRVAKPHLPSTMTYYY